MNFSHVLIPHNPPLCFSKYHDGGDDMTMIVTWLLSEENVNNSSNAKIMKISLQK